MTRNVPFNEVLEDLKKKHQIVKDVLESSENIKCSICGKNIYSIGLSRIKDICTDCIELVLSKDL